MTAAADGEAFCCHLSEDALGRNGNTGALNWINRFQFAVNNTGEYLSQVLSRPHSQRYEMSDSSTADMVTIMNPGKRLFYSRFSEPTFVNQRLIGLRFIDDSTNRELCHALLNSMLEMFITEATGFGRGLGVLDISSKNIKQSYMFNPSLLTEDKVTGNYRRF